MPTPAGGSGIARYELARSTDGGTTWTTVSTVLTASPAATTVTAGGTVRFRVRAVDRAGNTGAWMTGPVLRPALVQTPAGTTGLTYAGTWSDAASASYSGGAHRYATAAGASATYTVHRAQHRPGHHPGRQPGPVSIYLDGAATPVTLDTYAATTAYGVQVWSQTFATSGPHTVRVVVVGTAGRPRVDLDAFAILK